MSFLEGLDLIGADLGSEGAVAYARGAIIGAGARAGASTYAVAKALRENGIGFRYINIRDTLAAAVAELAAGQSATALQVDSTTGEILPGTPPADWTGQYVHQVTATFRTRDDEGNYQLHQRTLGIKGSTVLTPYEAAQAALGILETPEDDDTEGGYGAAGDLLSMQLTGVWYDTNPSALRGA